MRRNPTMQTIGRITGRCLLVASIGLAAALFCSTVLMANPVRAAFADTPAQVTLDGSWELVRQDLDTCVVAVPPIIGGPIHIEADFVEGTISGSFSGSGEGSHTVPGDHVCGIYEPVTWYAEIGVIDGTFSGPLDRATGAFDVEFDFYAEAWGYKEGPGLTWRCGTEDWTLTCALPEIWPDQRGTIAGSILPEGRLAGDFDLYTFDGVYCAKEKDRTTAWGDGCPTLGTWSADVTNVVWQSNEAPEVGGITASPKDPTTDDSIVFSVDATDPDNDDLTYAWYVDGTREGPSAPSVTWGKPTAGDHVIKVTVSDGGDTTDAFLDIRVSEHVGAGDQDNDGVPDDEDLCPTEWGEGDDGCPPFSVAIGCAPPRPAPEDAVVCTANVTGRHVGETTLFDWYLDGGSVQSGTLATWTWGSADSGTHDIGVQAVGEGRTSDSDTTLEVGGGLVSEEVAGFHIVSVGCNSGVSSDDTLQCTTAFERDRDDIGPLLVTWMIEFAPAASEVVSGNTASWSLAQPAPGDHTVLLSVTDPATNYSVGRMASGNVTPGKNAMVPPGVQAGAAVASTLTAGAWLWLEWARRRKEGAGGTVAPITDEDRYWDQRNREQRAAALSVHQRFADDEWAKFTRRCRDRTDAENAAALAARQDRQLRMMKTDRIEEIAQREGHDDLTGFLDRQLERDVVPSWKQLEQIRNGIVRRGSDQAAMDRYFDKSDVRVFLEGCHDTMAWGTGKVAGAVTGEVGGRIAEWLVRNPEVPIRVAVAGLTAGKSELLLIPLDALRGMETAADQKMAEQNLELTSWEATKEVVKAGAWYIGGEIAGDVIAKRWSGGGTAGREAVEEASEAAVKRAGAQTSDDFVRRVNAKIAAKRAAREAGEEIPDAVARRAAEAEELAGHVVRKQDDYLRTFAREGDVIPANHLHETGYAARDVKAAGKICADEGVEIYARTTNMDSMRHIRDGTALPKPLDIKAKTINELDTYLGAKPSDKGLVGYFKPVEPDLSKIPAHLHDDVSKRLIERADEFAKLSDDVKFQKLLDDDVLRMEGDRIIDTATGKPFAGDIDAVMLKDKATGKYLTGGDRYERVINRWRTDVGGQHGVEMNAVADITAPYRPGTPAHDEALAKATDLVEDLQAGHTSGKEVVVRFDADGALRRGPRDINLTPTADQILVEGTGEAGRAAPTDIGGSVGSTIGREWESKPDA
ncbi:MAG: hypothetical protein U9N79_07865 [Actinomycetota bacterium]|nr:hypothetical protein [Actinomycetota bacterium]